MPMSGLTHLIHLLENIECVVVFTLMNTEKLILLLFTATLPYLYLVCWVMSICWAYSVFKVERGKSRGRVSGRDRSYFNKIFLRTVAIILL